MPLTRRELLLAASLLPIPGVLAEPPKESITLPSPDAEDLYKEATRLLLRGRQFERAAEMLAQAAQKAPSDYRFPAARGCALISRAASLAYAAAHTEWLKTARASYPKALADWEKAQKDPHSEDHDTPRPVMPPARIFPTKDDGRPFRLTQEQTRQRLAELTAGGRAEFLRAEKLARTAEEKADAAYLYGWGLRVLAQYADPLGGLNDPDEDETDSEAAPKGETALLPPPDKKAVLAVFTRARDAAPDNALYWRSLGDTLLWRNEEEEADSAYDRAAELNPRDAPLHYFLYNRRCQRLGNSASIEGESPSTDETFALLRRAQKADPSNGWLYYEEASLHFRRTKHSLFTAPSRLASSPEQVQQRSRWYHTLATSEAQQVGTNGVTAVEKGNAAANCYIPVYRPAIPRLLLAAWGYMGWLNDLTFTPNARARELTRALSGYALHLAEQDRNEKEAVRACQAAMGMGRRLQGDWPTHDAYIGDPSVINCLTGHAICAIALKILISVEESIGTPERIMAAQAEYDALRERVNAHKAVLARWLEQAADNPGAMY
jgi:tetratricopeptide (TPR) repeat protein